MDLKRIKDLLEKYYNAETSLDEENVLRNYFTQGNIHEEFIAEKDIFLYNIQEKGQFEEIPDISDEIWNKLQDVEVDTGSKLRRINYLFLRIAASVIILIGTFFLLRNQVYNKSYNAQIPDTYQTPEQAYLQAKETLLYVSALMNKGTDKMKPINKVNKEVENLNKLSFLNEGIEELLPINTYLVTNKYFKQ